MMKYFVLLMLILASCVQPIGRQRDEHGCLGPAGYAFNTDIDACVREWELKDNQKEAAKIAVNYVGAQKGLTVIEVLLLKCPGCFIVNLQRDNDIIEVELSNWQVKS